ncbi:uncharacterized protein E0L32_002103 [Thyridium curvatum]|uniref:Sphingoid long-chain base transporter RSB1 n=1 Tax=Thyridium curvatum TaxID=1093900 RepID=A0A507AKC1_9PEZI|nr:uncharacterized protein E0L32_002030 [Thyridium curvatum]XP_030989211.1 uncharacterized protein E0L32_002103 [Thyridium curvatum]TPX07427.1 hypothetical protein E0L32_002030 [Thyridium curvatum]TPX07500.1 hypothetical protein E0L32_002103 [Thyridium curvatum]
MTAPPGYDPSLYPDGIVVFGSDQNCTLATCPVEWSILRAQPSIAANAVFIAAFGSSLLIHVVQGVWTKTWGFLAAMAAGSILEIVGYGGRIMLHDNPFSFDGFMMQVICITIAPVFYCAAIYVIFAQIINHLDASLSRIKPKLLYIIFIPCDIISLILQAVGGALSVVASTRSGVESGEHISLAGLIFQVIALGTFTIIFIDYLFRYRRAQRRSGGRVSRRTSVFLRFLFLSVVLILIRCVYRIIELQGGYFSATFRNEGLFIGLESSVMAVAVFCFNVSHPGFFFKDQDAREKMTSESSTD